MTKKISFFFLLCLMAITGIHAQWTFMADYSLNRSNEQTKLDYTDRGKSTTLENLDQLFSKGIGVSVFRPVKQDHSIGLHYRYSAYSTDFTNRIKIARKMNEHSIMASHLFDIRANNTSFMRWFIRSSAGYSRIHYQNIHPLFLSYTDPYAYDLTLNMFRLQGDFGILLNLIQENLYIQVGTTLGYEISIHQRLERQLDELEKDSDTSLKKRWASLSAGIMYRFGQSTQSIIR